MLSILIQMDLGSDRDIWKLSAEDEQLFEKKENWQDTFRGLSDQVIDRLVVTDITACSEAKFKTEELENETSLDPPSEYADIVIKSTGTLQEVNEKLYNYIEKITH